MVVRLPRIRWAVGQVEKSTDGCHGLPSIFHLQSRPIPKGAFAEAPWHWSVYSWLKGKNATVDRIAYRANRLRPHG